MKGGTTMKKTVLMLLLLFVLAGCSTSSSTPENSTAALTTHTHTTYHTEIDGEFLLYSNGSTVMGTKLNHLDRTFYQVEFSDTAPKYTELFTLKDLGGTSLVELDGENGIWVTYDFHDSRYISRFDFSGKTLLTIDFGSSDTAHAVLSMAWDEEYYYFLMDINRNSTGSASPYYLFGYDKAGNKVFEQPLFQISSDTQGYLDVEEEWMEDLEDNGEDNFLHGATDSFKLTRLQDGSAALLIYREAPIGQETYVIICPIMREPFSITPAFSFRAELYENFELLAVPLASSDPRYDLFFMTASGLDGIDLAADAPCSILKWEDIDYAINNRRENAAALPDGTLVLQDFDFGAQSHRYHLLTPAL